jgi:proteasome accessory factor B
VAGHDRARNAPRVFRLSRITGPVKMAGPAGSVTVPPDADVRELVKSWDVSPARDHVAVLKVRTGAGLGLRRWASEVTPDETEGWDRVTVSFADVPWYADHLASFGPDVMVLEPPDLREAVIRRLKGVLA